MNVNRDVFLIFEVEMKKLLIIIVICLAGISVKGQTTGEIFASMSEPLLTPLTLTNRLDLVDLFNAGRKAEVKNLLGDTCFLTKLTDNYLQIRVGNAGLELVLLPLVNDSKIICLIHTIYAPIADSFLEFYTPAGKKLNTDLFISPAGKAAFIKDGVDPNEQTVRNALIPLDIALTQFRYDPEKEELLQSYNTPEYLSGEEREKATPYLKETPLIFKWNQIRFEPNRNVNR
jgi:hypothetical protein